MDTRFVEVPKLFSRGNKELFSCYTGGSSGMRPYGLERNVEVEGGDCILEVNEKLETLEKEHKRVIHQVGELKGRVQANP